VFSQRTFLDSTLSYAKGKMGLDAESLEFRGKPFAHFVNLRTIRGICGDRLDGDCCREAINKGFLERINTIINTGILEAKRVEKGLLISHCRCG
jgi:hypothetical protein